MRTHRIIIGIYGKNSIARGVATKKNKRVLTKNRHGYKAVGKKVYYIYKTIGKARR